MTKNIFPPLTQLDESGNKIGTILFSKKPITLGKEKPEDITDQFEAGDEIYGMAYLPGTWEELGFDSGIKFYVHDIEETGYSWQVEYGGFTFQSKKDGTSTSENTFYDIDVLVPENKAYEKHLPKELIASLVTFLGRQNSDVYRQFRKHKWAIDLFANYKLIARGIIYYNIAKESVPKIEAMNNSYLTAHMKDFTLPETRLNDKALTEKLKQVMVKQGLDVQKILFTSDDWGLIHHPVSGAIVSRSIWANVVHKLKDGTCFYDEVQFIEEYVGNSFSGKVKKAGYGTASGPILCENVN